MTSYKHAIVQGPQAPQWMKFGFAPGRHRCALVTMLCVPPCTYHCMRILAVLPFLYCGLPAASSSCALLLGVSLDHIMMTCSDAAPSAGNSCAATSFSDLELESRLFHITDAAEG